MGDNTRLETLDMQADTEMKWHRDGWDIKHESDTDNITALIVYCGNDMGRPIWRVNCSDEHKRFYSERYIGKAADAIHLAQQRILKRQRELETCKPTTK